MTSVKTKSIRIEDDLWDKVRKAAIDAHVDISEFVTSALEDSLRKAPKIRA